MNESNPLDNDERYNENYCIILNYSIMDVA